MILTKVATHLKVHDGSEYVALTFSKDGEEIVKYARISYCARAVSSDLKREAQRLIVKQAREAARDFAFNKYGPDPEWKKMVNFGVVEEGELLKTAVSLLVRSAA